MEVKYMKNMSKVVLVLLVLGLVVRPTPSFAYWHHHDYVSVHFGVWPGYYGYPYAYDPYYYPYYAYPEYPSTVVTSPSFQPVVVNGVTYYLNNGVYYNYTQYGYQAVAPPTQAAVETNIAPAAVSAPASIPQTDEDTITINIPNKKGGYTPVVIKRSGNGYTGPQGEFYSEFPKVSQLQTIYGK
jgi:hypothetical protein